MTSDNRFSLEIPGEWALKKILGPTFDEVGRDLARLYANGRDRIFHAAKRKIPDLNDGKTANLRVARDVLWNGAFSSDQICAEYFGGILAASRSPDGDDDSAVPFVDVVKAMSSAQLKLHYSLYHCLAASLRELDNRKDAFDVSDSEEVCIPQIGARSDIDLEALCRLDLISSFSFSRQMVGDRVLPYIAARPSRFGIMLYAAAHNMLEWWQAYGLKDFGDFDAIDTPDLFASSLDGLIRKAETSRRSPVPP